MGRMSGGCRAPFGPLLLLLPLTLASFRPNFRPPSLVPDPESLIDSTTDSSIDHAAVIAQLERSLVAAMGLSRRPRPTRHLPVPPHLRDLYHQLTHQSNSRRAEAFDTATSFFPTPESLDGASTSAQADFRLDFALHGLDPNSQLEKAELRLNLLPVSHSESTVRLNLLEVVRNHSVLIDTKTLSCTGSSEVSLELTSAALRWRRSSATIGSLHIQLLSDSCRVFLSDAPPAPDRLSPSLILYSAHTRHQQRQRRRKRSSPEHNYRSSRHHRHRHHKLKRRGGWRRRERERREREEYQRRGMGPSLCSRRRMYVDFESVGWKDWVVAPNGYEAYTCSGSCPFPLTHHLNSTNHAIIQSMVHSVSPSTVPPACCVPTELSSIGLLYLNEFDSVVLKYYPDMVVQACGCR